LVLEAGADLTEDLADGERPLARAAARSLRTGRGTGRRRFGHDEPGDGTAKPVIAQRSDIGEGLARTSFCMVAHAI
jgi:hypothetical protein